MNIYFSGAIRGGWDNREFYKIIIEELKQYGNVLNPRVADESLFSREASYTDHEIYQSDMDLIDEADLLVADISQPSLGVGYEIGYAEASKKKLMVFFRTTSEKRVSVMLNGNSGVEIHYYADDKDLKKLIKDLFDTHRGKDPILDGTLDE